MMSATAVDRAGGEGGRPFLFDTKQDANPSETKWYGRNKYFGQMPLGISPMKGRIYQANQTLTLTLRTQNNHYFWISHIILLRLKEQFKSRQIDRI